MELYGKKMSRVEFTKYVGDISQIADARESILSSGKADGVRAVDVRTGSGFQFTVLPTRGMDIAWAEYKGQAVSFIGKAGVTHPAYFEKDGLSFLRGFFCGLVTTCGLTYFGAPCTDEGQELGLHGRISNIPAQNVCVKKYWEGDEYIIKISGQVTESSVFGENLVLTREIETKLGAKSVKITDTVENIGFDQQPLMILYHCNFGYPIVNENTVLIEPEGTVVQARDSEGVVEKCFEFQKPTHGYQEQVFYHNVPADKVKAVLYNPEIRLGAYVAFHKNQFSHFGEWKMMGEGDYVVGLEPSNAIPEGRDVVRARGELEFIQPGEKRKFELEIGIVEDFPTDMPV
ncbi:aldose 1-epimerase family protein [Blautia schinkii]|nr:aldose 1-epimerase family protein [Blautia schinkii]